MALAKSPALAVHHPGNLPEEPTAPVDRSRPVAGTSPAPAEATTAARLLNGGCALLSLAVLGDSGLEHYRGMFFNKMMYTPLAVSTLSLAASLHGAGDRSGRAKR